MKGVVATVSMMLVMIGLPMVSFTASAEDVRLTPDYEIQNDAYLLSSVEGADAASVLTRVTDGVWGDPDIGDTTLPDVAYPGDEYDGDPGCLYWGNRTLVGGGVYGTATIKIGVTDIVGASSDYWSVDTIIIYELVDHVLPFSVGDSYPNTFSNTLNCSIRVGFGSGSYTGWNDSVTYPGAIGSTFPPGYPSSSGYHYDIMNDNMGRAWSTDEINDGYVIITMRMDLAAFDTSDWPVSMVLGGIQIQVQSETGPPPPPPVPTGSFILRPNIEVLNATFGAYPSSTADIADATNETTHFSDGDTSYAYGTFSGALIDTESASLGFDDPDPGYTFANRFTVAPWVILRTSTGMSVTVAASVYENTDPGAGAAWLLASATTSYTNYSASAAMVNPRTNGTWTLAELANIEVGFLVTGILATGQLRVSQVAILVSPYWSDDTSWDFSGILQYLGGGMIPTLIGVMGFCMLVGVPTIAVLAYRSGESEGMMTVVRAAVLMVLGFGFFMVGLIGS